MQVSEHRKYRDFERPEIKFSMMYYDNEYTDSSIAEKVLANLEKFGFFPPEKMYIDRMTRGRYLKYKPEMRDMFIEAYCKPGVSNIGMADGDSRKVEQLWEFAWRFTFFKTLMLEKRQHTGTFIPWNHLSLSMTYGRFEDPQIYSNYFSFAKTVIEDVDPLCAEIDDVAHGNYLFDNTGEKTYTAEHVQQIYWGNYFGADWCRQCGIKDGEDIPAYSVEKIGSGVFFTLSDNVLDFDSVECDARRARIRKYLGLD